MTDDRPDTLANHWEELSVKDREYILYVLKRYRRPTKYDVSVLHLGNLPFIRCDEVVRILNTWPDSLEYEAMIRTTKTLHSTKIMRLKDQHRADLKRLIKELSPPFNDQLSAELRNWAQRSRSGWET